MHDMNASTQSPAAESTGNASADQAKADGMINETSYTALNNLFNSLNCEKFGSELQYRVSAAAMICNKAGILAGMAGGNGKSKNGQLEPTSYRQSQQSTGMPTASLPVSLTALQSQASISKAAPKYGDSELVSVSRSSSYHPQPVRVDYNTYRDKNGPPLAPRGEQSRVITNYGVSVSGGGIDFQAECGWDDIYNVDKNGQQFEFLEELFDGRPGAEGRKGMPARDLREATVYEYTQFERQINAWFDKVSTGRNNIV
jgi:hypothetical protein